MKEVKDTILQSRPLRKSCIVEHQVVDVVDELQQVAEEVAPPLQPAWSWHSRHGSRISKTLKTSEFPWAREKVIAVLAVWKLR